jgi:hypothetical protein
MKNPWKIGKISRFSSRFYQKGGGHEPEDPVFLEPESILSIRRHHSPAPDIDRHFFNPAQSPSASSTRRTDHPDQRRL